MRLTSEPSDLRNADHGRHGLAADRGLIDLATIDLGLACQKHRETFSEQLRRKIPASWQRFLPALRR